MILNNVRIALTGEAASIGIKDGKIAQILPRIFHNKTQQPDLYFNDAIVFPGLINSHDHLDFNLFPSLGDRTYANYTEWGNYIHEHYKDRINNVLKVPEILREQWGIYKNLLCGVTTVVNHGKKIKSKTDLIAVFENCQNIHSVQFEKKWKLALNRPFKKNLPVVIHCGEGTDASSSEEIDQLIRWNLLKRSLIAIHGVAMNEAQAAAFKALVWCPQSNYFLLEKTAAINRLKKHVPILFGTDSTLTGDWNIWDHIRLARKTRYLDDQELFDSLTTTPVHTWNLGGGKIAEGREADLVVARSKHGLSFGDNFFEIEPKDILIVVHKGNISLFDEELSVQLKETDLNEFSRVYIDGVCKFVKGNLCQLMQKIKQYYPEASFPVT